MNDGRIVAREFTGFFDSGAYMRLSPYAIVKCTGHLPGPYSIPNVASNVFCVVTNRTPATAMRGFGITAADFAIECHMDRVAEAVGMNPIELRILNAYRDGDMKAHRRSAKNTALIECCQVAAGKARWGIAADAAAQSSKVGGGVGDRAAIPETATDDDGKIGTRRAGQTQGTAPATRSTGKIPAGTAGAATSGAPVQNPDMQIDADRIGHRMGSTPVAAPQVSQTAPVAPTSTAPTPAATAPTPPLPSTPIPPPASTPPAAATPYEPEKPFSRGVNRPGASRFTSGFRRR